MQLLSHYFDQRKVLWDLVRKNLRARYAGSWLGILWAFLHPLMMAMVVGFVFIEILKVNMPRAYLFILTGMLPWSFLAGSLQEAIVSIPASAGLLKQFSFPRLFIPVSSVLSNLILFVTGLLVILPLCVGLNVILAVKLLPLILVAIFLHLLFVMGLAMVFSIVYVYFRDVHQVLNIGMVFWLWVTPVFYSIDMIPDKYRIIFWVNPMTPYVNLYRNILFEHSGSIGFVYLQAGAISLAVFAIGWKVFSKWGDATLKRI